MDLFTDSEKQFMLAALDTHVRQMGINVAKPAVVIAMKLNSETETPEETAKEKKG